MSAFGAISAMYFLHCFVWQAHEVHEIGESELRSVAGARHRTFTRVAGTVLRGTGQNRSK